MAECDSGSRARRWLEDKLWSDRGPVQAQGSLRTTLCEIRKCFGFAAELIGSDRTSVWLDKNVVSTDLDDNDATREFLEGLDIADPEFNDWLIRKRIQYDATKHERSDTMAHDGRVTIQCGAPWTTRGEQNTFPQIVDSQIGKIISEFIASSRCSTSETSADLIVRTLAQESGSGSAVLVQVIDPMKDEIIHSDHCFIENLNEFMTNQVVLGRFCWNVADLALEKLSHLRNSESPISIRSRFAQDALLKVLSFDATQMNGSLTVLDAAREHLNAGLFLALKAWSMTSMIMEEFLPEDQTVLNEIKGLLIQAYEISPDDPMVVAISANVQAVLFEEYETSLSLARRALRQNANNLFALQAMSVGRAARGDLQYAYDFSKHCKTISSMSKFEAMCYLHHSLLCISLGRTEEALSSSQLAADFSPNYRAPRRQLIALNAINNRSEKVLCDIENLKKIESDFSVERFLFDRSYPSNTLRKSGYLSRAQPILAGFE